LAIFLSTIKLVGVGLAFLLSGSLRETYPERGAILTPRSLWLAPAFLSLAAAMAATSIGRFKQRKSGYWLASAGRTSAGAWLRIP
jgi:hypothetical protein